jgi:putative FmdB family regulatory protein
MPTYEFKCNSCKKEFSLRMPVQDYDGKKTYKCPGCGSTDTKRIFSRFMAVTSKKT